jgi:hypothetical protein
MEGAICPREVALCLRKEGTLRSGKVPSMMEAIDRIGRDDTWTGKLRDLQ